MHKQKNKGFTLIELLVVIGIIALLATLITINVTAARQKSRNGKRRADIVSVQAPLEIYFDANKAYPSTSAAWWGTCSTYGSHDVTGANGWIPSLAPTYIKRLPSDPLNSNEPCYLYRSDGVNYKVIAYAVSSDGAAGLSDTKDTLYDPQRAGTSWMVCSGEPACSSW